MRISDWSSDVCSSDLDGIDGDAWNATMALVEQVLRSLDEFGTLDAEARVRTEAEVTAAVTNRLVDVGFAKVKLEELIAGLLEAYLESAASMAGGSSGVTERSEEHKSELQSLMRISSAVFCLQ